MDLLTDIFRSIRLEGSIFFNSTLIAPWDLRLDPSKRPRFHFVVDGETWVESTTMLEPIWLCRGDAVFLNDGGPHRLFDTLTHPERLTNAADATQKPRSKRCQLICGTFGFDEELNHPLIDTLPESIRLKIPNDRHSFWAMVSIMVNELDEQGAGCNAVVDRLCELFLMQVLRSHASDNPLAPGFVAALDDPITCRGLQLIHKKPELDWTLESLAQASGLSRSAFSKRFHRLVGMPPKAYLFTWRMHQAQRLLKNPSAHLATVAKQVGYTSDASFNRAFKQFFGKSPGAFKSEFDRVKDRRP